MELAIDTSTDIASIALSDSGAAFAELTWTAGQNHTVELMPSIVRLLAQARVEIDQMTAVYVAKGPGSFNGLRVGMAAAKGFAMSLDIPIVGIGTLAVQAWPYAPALLPICPVIPAGRTEIAAATFQQADGEWRMLVAEHITTVEDLCRRIDSTTIFCGRFPAEVADRIRELLGERAVVKSDALRRAGYLAELGWRRLSQGDTDDAATLQPEYLRRPPITTPRKDKR